MSASQPFRKGSREDMSLILIGDAVYSILFICITDYFIFDDKIIQFELRL